MRWNPHTMYNLKAPTGVRGRNSNNDLIRKELGWDYSMTLEEGIRRTYNWIMGEISKEVVEYEANEPLGTI